MTRWTSSWWLTIWLGLVMLAAFLFLQNSPTYGYALKPLTLAVAVAVAVVGLDLLFGAGHQLNLGHAFFFGVGAYGVGMLNTSFDVPTLAAAVLAVATAGLLAWPLGRVLLRLEGLYFAVATLGLGIIGVTLVMAFREETGGDNGLLIPPLTIGDISFSTPESKYWLVVGVAIIAVVVARNLLRSRRGLAIRAVGADEASAGSQGIDTVGLKVQLFVIASVYAAVGGVLYGFASGFVTPSSMGAAATIQMVVAVMLGGVGTILGPALATVFLRLLSVFFEFLEDYVDLVYGIALVALLMFSGRGGGTAGRTARRWLSRRGGRHPTTTEETPRELVH
jgi:branched-chain amino acid transport system permease protein